MSDDLLKHAEETAREFRSTMPPSVMKEWGKEAATLLNAMRKRVREAEEARDVFAELNRIGSENAEAVRKDRDTALASLAAERAAGARMREAILLAHTRIINLGLLDPDGRIETVRLGLAIALDRASTAAEAGRHE